MHSGARSFPIASQAARQFVAAGPLVYSAIATASSRGLTAGNSSLRGSSPRSAAFWLKPVAPFRLDLTVWALRRRPTNLIDRWDGQTYRRVLVVGGKPVEVAVRQQGPPESSRLRVIVTDSEEALPDKQLIRRALDNLLGFRLDLSPFYQLALSKPKLKPLVERFRGVKPPRFCTLFEALANAIACQQMSLSLGILLLSRLAERYGLGVNGPAGAAHAFPRPEDLLGLEPEAFRELGFSRQKGRALIALAQAFGNGSHEAWTVEPMDNVAAIQRLLDLRGIGRWSAEYALLRGLGRLDVIPGDDVGARNNLQRWLRLRRSLDYDGVRRVTAPWQPYAGLVYFHLLLERLGAAGHLGPEWSAQPSGGGA